MTSLLPIVNEGLPTGVVPTFASRIDGGMLRRNRLDQLQINLGKLCNQTCTHCHVDAGPTKKRENMDAHTADRLLELVEGCSNLTTVDLTGGAPEMNPNFRRMAKTFRESGLRVIDRCNLTILSQPGYEWVAPFLAEHEMDVVASLPCYLEDNVDGQRGDGVFGRSIEGLLRLNQLGYRQGSSTHRLDLVYNPTGPSLPPDQMKLEADYRRELAARYGIEFGNLLTITNIPIRRYAQFLQKRGLLDDYLKLLSENFNARAAAQVMCRSLVSISWDGQIFDCDFNQMIELSNQPRSIWSIDSLDELLDQRIALADHCYGCTAGSGSGCGGALLD
ncbi:arsenosugar biosynthesis radical SAM (seleno)protein ArsS [Rhodopirellula halodulae]|uniref:arsenosugar biosynthesis radical SAM (seleno)protein ArsS n=1 Tax=Rhodopirellula halodulae TaxID=2894198 RepID=UPI001E2FFE52|nr:arsenosugar biosynthesis radical SAM (seleno)protein ArsS [Rhodopirellula sp. JC737]MCC9657750.1 arsenosugar biosynthesis radical SAM protein ArsS [Rhodopirellula sp. JC737]